MTIQRGNKGAMIESKRLISRTPWRRRVLLVAVIAAAAAAGALPAAAGARPRAPHVGVTLSVPSGVQAGGLVRATGQISKRVRHARASLQQRVGGRWVSRARGGIGFRARTFSLRWRAPRHTGSVLLRVRVTRGAPQIGVSRRRRVQLLRRGGAPGARFALPATQVAHVPAPGVRGAVRYDGQVSVQPGDIIATGVGAHAPDGFLGVATSVRRDGSQTVVQTKPTTLLAAVPNGSIDTTVQSRSRVATARGAVSHAIAKSVSCGFGRSVALSGSVVVNPSVSFRASWSFGRVSTASFTGAVSADATLKASATGTAGCALSRTPIARWDLGRIDVQVGVLPVVIVPQITLYISADGHVSTTVSSAMHGSFAATAGLSYDHGKISPVGSATRSFGSDPPTVSNSAHLDGNIIPTADLLFYGVAGPEASLSAGLSFDANPSQTPWWTLTAPIDLGARLVVPTLGLSTGTLQVYHHDFPLAHATTPYPGGGGGGGTVGGGDNGGGDGLGTRHTATYATTGDLECSLTAQEDSGDEFFGGSGSGTDACGTFLAVDGTLYGPSNIPAGGGLGGYTSWTPVDQSTTGDGSTSSPYSTVTTVAAGDSGIQLTETDTWQPGGSTVDSSYALTSAPGDTRVVQLYRGADCYLGNSDAGQGGYDPTSGSVACLQDQGGGTSAALQLVPLTSGGTSVEDSYDQVWVDIGAQTALPGTCQCSSTLDNGFAIAWPLTLQGSSPVSAKSRFVFTTAPSAAGAG